MGKVWTKDAEREQLRKIEALIEETEPGSYIRMSFSGILEMAERNIAEDSANNMPDAVEYREKQIADLKNQMRKMTEEHGAEKLRHDHEADAMSANLTKANEELATYKDICHRQSGKICEMQDQIDEMRRNADGANALLADKDSEIIRLKAEIYDLMKGEKNK